VTPRTRTFVALALVLLVLTPVGVALAANGEPELGTLAEAAGTSTSQSTSGATTPSTTTAPTTTVPVTEAPTTVPVTEAPTTEAPTTVAPTTPPTTRAPERRVAPTPVTFPAPPPIAGPPVTVDAATAFEYAKEIIAANTPPPAPEPGPAPEPPPAPDYSDNPLDQLNATDQAFLACVRWRESRNDYTAVNRSSGAGGAYQFMQSTWNITAAHFGRPDLIGLRPNYATPHDQDMLAVHLLLWYGRSPWAYYCG